jgi:hypothetical protein
MSRIPRDARFLFVLLWTIADDEGRLLAEPSELADLLFAPDQDAPMFMVHWLDELEREGCIERYQVDGRSYLRIVKWRDYQKIDHPTASLLPPSPNERPTERLVDSRIRERSRKIRRDARKTLEQRALLLLSRSLAEKNHDEENRNATPDHSEKGVLNDLLRLQQASEACGELATALRTVDFRGRHLGMWGGKGKKTGRPRSPPLSEIVP